MITKTTVILASITFGVLAIALAVASGLVQDMTGYHNTGEMLFMCSLASFCAAGFVAITEA